MFKAQIKLSVLNKLSKKNFSGYELMKELGINLGKKPSPGYIYPLLKDLKNKGFIKEVKLENKKIYSLTNKGRKLLKELIGKREETIRIMLKILRPLSDKEEIGKFIKMTKWMKDEGSFVARDYKLWIEFRKEIMMFWNKNYENKKEEFRSILENTISKLKELNKK